ncbi:MAG: VIT1/CCC1 transporter family protein [Parachlamydiaceae bacterium]|nr:VIT1/CCC1 transporter family protein [Parachlamydiaceae bacterium]
MHTPSSEHGSVGKSHNHDKNHDHFNGKNAIDHVIEAQAEGIIAASEVHGLEPPGHFSAACDAARETAILLILIWIAFADLKLPSFHLTELLIIIAFGFLFWKAGRSAWLGWFRLERLHRILEQERYEIEHHRAQERDELRVLYATKGFEGKLLEDVLDVLMADNDRLLKIMVEEELGLSLASQEHPLKQGLGAAFGVFTSSLLCIILYILSPSFGLFIGAALIIAVSSSISARLAQNKAISAIIWNLGIAALSVGVVHFLLQLLTSSH